MLPPTREVRNKLSKINQISNTRKCMACGRGSLSMADSFSGSIWMYWSEIMYRKKGKWDCSNNHFSSFGCRIGWTCSQSWNIRKIQGCCSSRHKGDPRRYCWQIIKKLFIWYWVTKDWRIKLSTNPESRKACTVNSVKEKRMEVILWEEVFFLRVASII